ncbi:MAG: protein-glutamate O-methyltransferase CheR [Nitrospirae bacterium]|nr:protein-glutamate O-methyltransferase CheR [Nitrospirota bacterium]
MLTTNTVKMSDNAFYSLRDMIYSRSGMHFPDNKKYLLENRLARHIEDAGYGSFDKYIDFLKHDAGKEKEFTFLFNIITTNETFFFRDIGQLQAFESVVLPEIVKKLKARGSNKLRIWSAACSTGEEPYTLSIMVSDTLSAPEYKDWDIEIHGSDISEAVLSSARRGEYNDYSVRNLSPQHLDRYFTKNGGGKYAIKPDVKRLVRFSNINLSDDAAIRMYRGMDIIFCRNVLIYFDEASKKKVISSLYNSLLSGGYLFIGHSESLFNISRAFKIVNANNVLIYQK